MKELPKGLVLSTGQAPAVIGDVNAVDLGDIVQLWKAYSANASVHEGDIGHRLENFFWRIWSSESLRRSMDGSRLAKLFLRISGASPLSLATPQPTTSKEPKEQLHSSPTTKDDKSPSTNSSNRTPMPPPILKKSNTSHGETQKTTRLLLTGIGGQSITRKPSTPPTPVPPPPTRKTYFVASKAKSTKRRPVLMRRKSSQTSSGASTRAHSPQRISTPLTCSSPVETERSGDVSEVEQPLTAELPKLGEAVKTVAKISEFPSSSPSSPTRPQTTKSTAPQKDYLTSVNRPSAENLAPQPSSSSLVDKDFRTRFAERQRHEYEDPAPLHGEAADADTTNTAPHAITNETSKIFLPSDPISTPSSDCRPSLAGPGIPIATPAIKSGRLTSEAVSPQTMSTSKGRSQLSVLIEESRSKQAEARVVSIPENELDSADE